MAELPFIRYIFKPICNIVIWYWVSKFGWFCREYFLLILPISYFDELFKCNDNLLRKPSLWSLTVMQADVSVNFLILSSIAKFSANNFHLKLKFFVCLFFLFYFKAFVCFDYVFSYTFIVIIFLVRYIFFRIHQQALTDSCVTLCFLCLILV